MERYKYILGFCVLAIVIYIAPIGVGLDSSLLYRFLNNWLQGGELYTVLDGWAIYAYTPWATLLMLPLALFNEKFGFAILTSASIFSMLLWAKRYNWGYVKFFTVLLSPSILYVLHLGQVDLAFSILPLIAPKELWPLMAGVKPQTLLGYGFGFFRHREVWRVGILLTLTVIAASFVFFGNWPIKVIELSRWTVNDANFNIARHIWPYSIGLSVVFIWLGYKYDDSRWFLMASPFFLPYTTLVHFAGVTLAFASLVRTRYLVPIVIIAWLIMFKLSGLL